eukprot:6212638-Pleurochrysis_carterae.AAC.1
MYRHNHETACCREEVEFGDQIEHTVRCVGACAGQCRGAPEEISVRWCGALTLLRWRVRPAH